MSLVTPCSSQPCWRQGEQRALDVVDGLGDLGVGQPAGQRLLVVGAEDLGIEVGGAAVGGGQRDAGQRAGAPAPGAAEAQPDAATVAGVLVEPLGDVVGAQPGDGDVEALVGLGGGGVDGGEQPLAQHPELQVVEEPVDLVAVPLLAGEVVEGDVDGDVADQLGQPAVELDAGDVLAQRVADLALDRVDAVDEIAQRAVLADPLGRRLLADAGDAGQVVAGVAAQGGVVGVLRRRQVVLGLHLAGREAGHLADAALGVEHGDVVVDQLQRVAVAGADQHVHAGGGGLGGDGGDDVVGLEPLDHHRRDAQRVEDLADQRDLAAEVVGGLAAAGLVAGVGLAAERLARHVEGDGHVRGFLVAHQVDQHRGEPEDGVGGLAGRRRHVDLAQRVERAIGQRVPVEQQQRGGLRRRGGHV